MNSVLDLSKHPCFNEQATSACGRVHLPVAPKCNIKCNYCDRRFACVNESRPRVASAILTPTQALRYLDRVLAAEPSITVAGIAGPGDPFANADETLETMRLVRKKYPQLLLCLSSNGFGLLPHLDPIAKIDVSHVTVTVNAVDPLIGEKIYAWARDGKMIYRGRRAAEELWSRQLEAIRGLKERGLIVKVNCIVIPGVNDEHVPQVARSMAELKVDVFNCMAMVPNAGAPFANLPEPSHEQMARIRGQSERYLPQMKHCQRCRADAVGLLETDCAEDFRECLDACAAELEQVDETRPNVAVATREGILVNRHLGEADRFEIWTQDDDAFRRVDVRKAPPQGGGVERWRSLGDALSDCRAVLVSGVGKIPEAILAAAGVPPIEMSGFIELGLEAVYGGRDPRMFRRKRNGGGCSRGVGCKGDGLGCG